MILCIETSTDVCSVALCQGNNVVSHIELYGGNAHAANLTPLIERIMNETPSASMAQLDAVAVSAGPGSYTGLRIGVSTAKGICYALGKPLIGVCTLDIVAEAIAKACPQARYIAPMLDARRMEVYTQLSAPEGLLMEVQPMVVDEASFAEHLADKEIYFGGNGAAKCQPVITSANAHFVPDIYPLALNMASLANAKFERGEFESVAYFEPFYLKEFVATVAKNKVLQ